MHSSRFCPIFVKHKKHRHHHHQLRYEDYLSATNKLLCFHILPSADLLILCRVGPRRHQKLCKLSACVDSILLHKTVISRTRILKKIEKYISIIKTSFNGIVMLLFIALSQNSFSGLGIILVKVFTRGKIRSCTLV